MEETKKCNKCGVSKPIGNFYKLRPDRPWRRSVCKTCHRIKDRENRKVRYNIINAILLILLALPLCGQSLQEKRQLLLDSINYYRADPVSRVKDSYDLTLNKRHYKPIEPYRMTDRLNIKAQAYAEKMARTGKYYHSNLRGVNGESIDAINEWEGDYSLTVYRLIVDKGVPNKSHRFHMLMHRDSYIGLGIAESRVIPYEDKPGSQKFTYICIKTDYK